jgi:protein-tyrosine-phosphatase
MYLSLAGNLCGIVYSQAANMTPPATAREGIIVFVCEHGAAKSIVAAAYFNKLARERNLKYQAIARGTAPQEEISVSARKGLADDGLTATEQKPAALSKGDLSGAVLLVAFCPLPEDYKSVRFQEWNDVPTVSEDYNKARDTIVEHVKRLLDELESKK